MARTVHLHHHHHHHLLLLPSLNPPASSSSELAFWVRAVRCVAGLQIVKVCISTAEEASDQFQTEDGSNRWPLHVAIPCTHNPNPAEQCKYFSGSMCYCTSSVSASLTIRAFDPYPES